MTQRATWLALALLGFGCAPGLTDDDPPDPMLPLEGTWEVVERETFHTPCDGGSPNQLPSRIIDIYFIRHLHGRLFLSFGQRDGPHRHWLETGIRCPVSSSGHWRCRTVLREQSTSSSVTKAEHQVSGQVTDDPTVMRVQFANEQNYFGDRRRRDYCGNMERSTIQFIPPRIYDPD